MIFRVSNISERLVGKLDAGEDLVESLSEVCKDRGVTAGAIRAVGHFDAIELVHFNGKTKSYETLVDGEGSFDLVSLHGNVSRLGNESALRLDAVFNVVGPVGPQMVGGQLRRARATNAEFVIDKFVDLDMERRLDPKTGRLELAQIKRKAGAAAPSPVASSTTTTTTTSSSTGSASAASSPAEPESVEKEAVSSNGASTANKSTAIKDDGGSSMSWDQAINEAERTEKTRETRRTSSGRRGSALETARSQKSGDPYQDLNVDEPIMGKGDILDHPKLGRCRVIEVEDDQYARIRLPRGRIRKLVLEILDVEFEGKEDGKNVFAARVKR